MSMANSHSLAKSTGFWELRILGFCGTKTTFSASIPLSHKCKYILEFRKHSARCLKITEKVSINIASYVYILSGQKLIKNAKNGPFWRVFEDLKLAVKQSYQTSQF